MARGGDAAAFAELVRRHHGAVLGVCLSMLSSAHDADDAAQEAFLKAHRSLARFRGDAAFGTWLHRIAANHCLDVLRRRTRERSESWEALVERDGDALRRLLEPRAAPDRLEQAELIERVLSQLPADQRAALTLREAGGLRYDDIAAALGCSLDAVKARLRRARRTLEEGLRHFLGPEDV